MYIQIKKSKLVPDKFGKHIEITMVGLYEDSGKWIRWIKLNETYLTILMNQKISVK